jgi:hypothetical protein
MIALTVIRSGWARTWGGTDIDTAASVGVDASGFIYVTGIFYGTVDFDPGPGIQEITGAGSLDCYLSKFDTSGRLVWVRTWGGAFWDQPTDLALDESGNIYVTGYFSDTVDFDPGPDLTEISSHGDWDCFVSKFNPNGDFQWVRTWGDGYWDMSMGIAVDDTSFYVTGEFRGVVDFDPGPGVTEYNAVPGASFLSRFDTSGNFKWARAWSGDGGYDDEGMAVAARGGSIYVTGVFDGKCDFDPGSGKDEHTSFNYYQDIYLSKFVANGDFQWAWTWGGEVDDWPGGAAIDSAGNVYVTGRYGATVDFDPGPGVDNRTSNGERDAFLTTFAPDGTYRWANTWGGSSGGFWDLGDDASDVFIDGTYTIYVCGYFNGTVDFDPGPGIAELTTNGSEDAFIQVLDPTGAYLWARSWGGQGIDHAYGVAVDSLGNSYVCGDFTSSADFDPGPWVDEHFSDGKDGSFLTKFLPDGVW